LRIIRKYLKNGPFVGKGDGKRAREREREKEKEREKERIILEFMTFLIVNDLPTSFSG